MQKKRLSKTTDILFCLCVALLFCYPYLCRDFLGIEHDTFFHLSRIDGLATAIKEGDFFPAIYPYKNMGFGYASPLFYCEFFLYVPAMLHLAGMSLASSYKILIFLITFLFACNTLSFLKCCTKGRWAVYAVTLACVFSSYRITNIYVRGALGESIALSFLPMVVQGCYEVLVKPKKHGWIRLSAGLTFLILSHNLSFVLGMICLVLFCIFYYRNLTKSVLAALFKALLCAFLFTAWFTLPMLEQLASQDFYLDYYASSSDLAAYALPLWKYVANTTIFGYANNSLPKDQQMIVNIGYFLEFVPLAWPFVQKKKSSFGKCCFGLGIFFLLFPSQLIPWDALTFLRVFQFPWRFMNISLVLLGVPCVEVLERMVFKKQKPWFAVLASVLLIAEGIWHLYPATKRTFGITGNTTWADLLNGELCDPCYSATYVRIECAGGDYLPITSPDYRTYSTAIQSNGTDLDISYKKNGTSLFFTLDEASANTAMSLPLTYYKGYRVYRITEEGYTAVKTSEDEHAMVCFESAGSGDYVCVYEHTPLQTGSALLSIGSLAIALVWVARLKMRTQNLANDHRVIHKVF